MKPEISNLILNKDWLIEMKKELEDETKSKVSEYNYDFETNLTKQGKYLWNNDFQFRSSN